MAEKHERPTTGSHKPSHPADAHEPGAHADPAGHPGPGHVKEQAAPKGFTPDAPGDPPQAGAVRETRSHEAAQGTPLTKAAEVKTHKTDKGEFKPRVIEEYRRANTDGSGGMTPARLSDFPEAVAAKAKRWKVAARVPFVATFPPSYLLACDEAEAKEVYKDFHGLGSYPLAGAQTLNFTCREMPD